MKKYISAFLAFLVLCIALPSGATVIVQDASPGQCDFRCTLVSGSPVADGSTSGNGTIYGDAYQGNLVALYDGQAHWKAYPLTSEIGYALSGITTGTMYDLYIYWTGTAIAFDTPVAWSNVTTPPSRTVVNGVICKGGNTTRRLVASFFATGTNLTMDTVGARCLSNQAKRVTRLIYLSGASSYSYNGGWRNAQNSTNSLSWVGIQFAWFASSDGTNQVYMTSLQDCTIGSTASVYAGINFSGSSNAQQSALAGSIGVYGLFAPFSAVLAPGFNSINQFEQSANASTMNGMIASGWVAN